jgi:hypothetical protein
VVIARVAAAAAADENVVIVLALLPLLLILICPTVGYWCSSQCQLQRLDRWDQAATSLWSLF